MATLVLTHEDRELLWFHLRDRTLLGRGLHCDVPLVDPTLSREQAAIEKRGAHYVLVDCSGQGTKVNGRLTQEAQLKDGDDIRLGEWVAFFRTSVLAAEATVREPRPAGTEALPRRFLAQGSLQLRVRNRLGERLVPVGEGELTIGSAPGNDLVLADRAVSARHARVRRTSEGLAIQDLGSTNGIYLVGAGLGAESLKVRDLVWVPGVALRLGQTELRLEWASARPGLEGDFEGMVGRSAPMLQLYEAIDTAAPSDLTVLIQGESGSGKEGTARAIHARSQRRLAPFLACNCTGLAATLAESQLFGHEKGAFTGADRQHKGIFEEADGGTLFLDEIGDLPLELQPKLLRVLQEGEVVRLGSTRPIQVDVRVVAATQVDLPLAVQEGRFRLDLYYRLNAFPLRIPRLVERPDDLPRLVAHFLQQLAPRGETKPISAKALEKLQGHTYQGSIRELKSLVARAVAMCRGGPVIEAEHIVFDAASARPNRPATGTDDDHWLSLDGRTYEEAKLEVKRRALRRHGGNKSAAARELGVDRGALAGL